MLQKFIVYSLSFMVLSLFAIYFAPISNAQTASPSASPIPYTLTPIPSSVSPTSPLYTDLIVHNLFHSFSCLAVGQSVIGQPCLTYQMTKNAQGMIQGMPMLSSVNTSGGVLGTTTNLIGALYTNRPVTTVDYLASISGNFGLVREANAQVVGSGAQVLNPILTLWQTSRNISYVLMIIIFLIIGLMVMFRNKINPQTVITAQAALPGLVIGLIMITFSYFFAGLISDMAFVGTNVVGYYFSIAQRPADPPQNLVGDVSSRSILSIFTPFTRILDTGKVRGALGSIWNDLGDPSIPWYDLALDPQRVIKILTTFMVSQLFLPIGNLAPGLGTAIAALGSVVAGQATPLEVASFALAFVGILALIYAMLRLLLRLVNNYLTIIFLTITAPFQFLFAALPGRQGVATNWILNMLANILAFPAVLAVLYFIAFLLGPQFMNEHCPTNTSTRCPFQISRLNQDSINSVMPTAQAADTSARKVIGQATFPLFGGLDLSFVELLLAFGALLALPAIPDIIARSVGTLSQAGQILGQEIGASTGAGQRYAGQIQQGTTGGIGQVGRLTDESGFQLVRDETSPTGWAQVPTRAPGQISRIGTRIGNIKSWIRARGGGGAVT